MSGRKGLLDRIREELRVVQVNLEDLSSCCGDEDGKCVVIAIHPGDGKGEGAGKEPAGPEGAPA